LLSPVASTLTFLEQSLPCPSVELRGHMTAKEHISPFSIATVKKERCKRKTESYYETKLDILNPPIKDKP